MPSRTIRRDPGLPLATAATTTTTTAARPRRATRRGEGARLAVSAGIVGALLLASGIAAFGARGTSRHVAAPDRGVLPGVTLDADLDAARALPLVVTSLRSQGPAWRGGVRVGDRLEAIDGVPVPGRGALLRALAADPARVIVLRLRRGTGTVDVRLDRGHGTGRHDA